MKRKYVKVFEELDKSGFKNLNEASEPIDPPEDETPENEDTPTEIPKYDDDEPVTSEEDKVIRPGQKRAKKVGNDILRRCEYAVCYLNAKNNTSSQDTRKPGDTSLTRAALAMGRNDKEDWTRIPAAQLSKFMTIKPSTISKTVRKFKYLLDGGDPAGVKGECMWDDLVSLFRRFKRMPEESVRTLAKEAFTGERDETRYQEYLDKSNDLAKKSLLNKKATDRKIFDKTYSLYKGLKDVKDPVTGRKKYNEVQAAKKAILKAESESVPKDPKTGLREGEPEWTRDRIQDVMVELSKKDPLVQKYFRIAFKETQPAAARNIMVGPGQDQTER